MQLREVGRPSAAVVIDRAPGRQRRRMRIVTPVALALGALVVASCGADQSAGSPPPVGVSVAALDTSPQVSDFVLYAERSITLGLDSVVSGGDVGVRTPTVASFGAQLVVGDFVSVAPTLNLLAPSTLLEFYAHVGGVQTGTLQQDSGSTLFSQGTFPAAAMPPLPLALPALVGSSNETVGATVVTTLPPGSYGSLSVAGTVVLTAGVYSFSSVTLGAGARLDASAGGGVVDVRIQNTLALGTCAIVGPTDNGDEGNAGQLLISVFGNDGPDGSPPAVAIGVDSTVRALLAAPHGTVTMGDGVQATGAFAGFDIQVGPRSTATYQTGFAAGAPGQQGSQQLAGYVIPPASTAAVAGPVPEATIIPLAIGLPIQDPVGLQALIQQVSDPTSPSYRQYLTVSQFTATYGPSPSDYQALIDWAQSQNLSVVATYPNRLLLDVSGTAADVEQALYVDLNLGLRPDGTQFYEPDREPSLDLAIPLLRISGLDNYTLGTPASGSGTNGYLGQDFRNAYGCPGLDGSGQTIGIFELDGFNTADINSYLTTAGQPYVTATNQPNVTFNKVLIDGFSGLPSGGGTSKSDLEVALDVEMVAAMAPGANILVFEAPNNSSYGNDVLNAMATTGGMSQASSSWYFAIDGNTQQIVNAMAAQGTSFFVSSGDGGGYIVSASNLVALDNLTVVGGTILSMNGSGVSYASETTWSDGNGASGGGFAGVPIPGYQQGVDMTQNNGSTVTRNLPDVSMVAESIEVISGGAPSTRSGTSASAPLWAGFMALTNQQSASNGLGPVGFFNPVLYAIGNIPAIYSADFNDIADGSTNAFKGSLAFPAVTGYDLATGWGSPKCALANQLGSSTPTTVYNEIELLISTGGDDLRSDSEAQATLFLPGASTPFQTIELKSQSDPAWDDGSVHDLVIPLNTPLSATGLGQVVVTLIEHNGFIQTNDNWNIETLDARLVNPGSPEICVAQVSGDPAVRLTGDQLSVTFSAGEGCPAVSGALPQPAAAPPGTIQLIISTGGDDLRSDSEAQATIVYQGTVAPQTVELKPSNAGAFNDNTALIEQFSLSSTAPIAQIVVTLIEHDGFIETDDNWNINGMNIVTFNPSDPETCLIDLNGDPLVRLTGSAGSVTFTPRSGCP